MDEIPSTQLNEENEINNNQINEMNQNEMEDKNNNLNNESYYTQQPKKKERMNLTIVSISNLFHAFDEYRKRTKPKPKDEKKQTEETRGLLEDKLKDDIYSKKTIEMTSLDPNDTKKQYQDEEKKKKAKEEEEQKPTKEERYTGCCDYFCNLVLFMFILLTLNVAILWCFMFMIAQPKNNFYCFDIFAKEFKICERPYELKDQEYGQFIFTNDYKADTTINEVKELNDKYLEFFTKELNLFSTLNQKFSKTDEVTSLFTIYIVPTKGENYLFRNTFRLKETSFIVDMIFTLIISMTIGDIFFGLLGDIVGRKKTLIISILTQILGMGVMVFLTYCIEKKAEIEGNGEFSKVNMFNFDYHNFEEIENFLKVTTNDEDPTNLDQTYKANFNQIQSEILKSNYIRKSYNYNKVYYFTAIALVFFANSPTTYMGFVYIVETALSEDSLITYYLYYHFSYPIGIFLAGFVIIITDSFKMSLFCLICLYSVICLILGFCFDESMRFYFEYSMFDLITDFSVRRLNYNPDKKKEIMDGDKKAVGDSSSLKGNGSNEGNAKEEPQISIGFALFMNRETDKEKIKYEIKQMNDNKDIPYSLYFKPSFIVGLQEENVRIKTVGKKKIKLVEVNRAQIIQNPFHLFSLMLTEKELKNHFFTMISFVCSISIVMNLILTKVTSSVFLPREKVVNGTNLLGTLIFGYIIVYIIALVLVYYVVKFFGIIIILICALTLIIVASLIFEVFGFLREEKDQQDINSYLYNSFSITQRDYKTWLEAMNMLVLLGNTALMYSLYFYLTKITKTIYRCTFYGLAQAVMDFTLVISIAMDYFIDKTYFYIFLFAEIGVINSIFITSKDSSLTVEDLKEIQYNVVKKNKSKIEGEEDKLQNKHDSIKND